MARKSPALSQEQSSLLASPEWSWLVKDKGQVRVVISMPCPLEMIPITQATGAIARHEGRKCRSCQHQHGHIGDVGSPSATWNNHPDLNLVSF